jgi:hypothetical protein
MQEVNMLEVNMLEVSKQEPPEVCRQEPLEVSKQEENMLEENMMGLLGAGMLVRNRTEPCNKQQEPWACIRSLDYQLPSPRRQPRSKWRNSLSTSFHKNFEKSCNTVTVIITVAIW